MKTRTIYNATNKARHKLRAVMEAGTGPFAPETRQIAEQIVRFEDELLRRIDELDATVAKAKAWDTFVDDFYRHGTAVDWKAFQNLRRSVGDYRMDVDERPPYRYQPYTTPERIGQYMAGLSDSIKADDIFGGGR